MGVPCVPALKERHAKAALSPDPALRKLRIFLKIRNAAERGILTTRPPVRRRGSLIRSIAIDQPLRGIIHSYLSGAHTVQSSPAYERQFVRRDWPLKKRRPACSELAEVSAADGSNQAESR